MTLTALKSPQHLIEGARSAPLPIWHGSAGGKILKRRKLHTRLKAGNVVKSNPCTVDQLQLDHDA